MKNKNKTIVEANKGSMTKKIGRYAVIVALYIAIVSTLAFIISTISLIVNADSINDTPDYQYLKTSYYNWDNITWYTDDNICVTGSNDTFSTENLFVDYYNTYIPDISYTFSVQRINVYNDSLSDIDLFVYDSTYNTDLTFDSIVFEKSDFFVKVGDLNSLNVPMISAIVLNGGYDITFEISGFVRDVNGNVRDLSIVTDKRIDVLGYQSLYPTFSELFGGTETINNNSMMYLRHLRVLVEFPNNYADVLRYRYSVSSIENNNIKYGGAFSSWVNQSSISNLGNDLLSSVNGFLAFELVPGLSLMSILILLVVIPLLIWILRLFLGG